MGFRAPMYLSDVEPRPRRARPQRTFTDYAAGALLGFSIAVLAIVALLAFAAAIWTVTP